MGFRMISTPVQETQIPTVAQWSIYAMGVVEGNRIRRAKDPVASWLLRRFPELESQYGVPSVLSMIRERAAIVDRMLVEEFHRAERMGTLVDYTRMGGGFDGRFYRLFPHHLDRLHRMTELEEPELLAVKNAMLRHSNFVDEWSRVEQVALPVHDWTMKPSTGLPVVNLEGAATRIGLRLLVRVLGAIRRDCPQARVILDLPNFLNRTGSGTLPPPTGPTRLRWENLDRTGAGRIEVGHLRELGWSVDEDLWLVSRPELRAANGVTICPGVEGLRVLRLVAC